jgi:hypothetical protein
MTDWRERRLGVRARQWNRRESEPAQQAQAAPAPLIITVALRQSAQNHAEEALEALAGLVRNASSEHVRVAAANAILDRALGKPLPGAKAAADHADGEEDGPLEVRWLGEDL